ncbi:MAG: 2-C-methyl-D-erythritol 4-phosphate cytidylyltransferase [Lachnospiraceae bacterium]|nr:2-C-methyl-D-erythritol 4-phosphate cytidylyltransferase [Lachnospiraceae bacterium]
MEKKKYAGIILAAGSGSRMKSSIPKQYIEIDNRPLIYYTLDTFERSVVDEIILVVRPGDEDYVKREIVERYSFSKVRAIVAGGDSRTMSVYNGIKASEADYVLIHDGARACASVELVNRMADQVLLSPCIAAVPSKDTVKISDSAGYVESTPKRENVYIVQTPQAFNRKELLEAYLLLEDMTPEDKSVLTDDSMIMENAGKKVRLVAGEYSNIKVTTPEDLDFIKIIKKN